MRQSARAHYVRGNKVTRVPRNHIYVDTEAFSSPGVRVEVQTFRCAVAAYDRRRHDGDGWRDRQWGTFTNTADLWAWIDRRCQKRARTVLVAHNLAYDLRISDAFGWLPANGWSLKAIRLDDRQAWCSWRKDDRTLVMVDSLSWVPLALEKLGELIFQPKLPLPDWEDSDAAWLARCRRDVEILAEVWRRLVAWVDGADLGNWKPTGAGQSWAAYRHRFMEHHLFVHEDDDARGAERAASFTGRCEAWRHGRLKGGPYTEWDYTCAYSRIGDECGVPIKLNGELARPSLDDLHRAGRKHAVLAEVTVTTDVPTVPFRDDRGISWPVGTFQTTLWDNELGLALAGGAHVVPVRAWWYRRAPALQKFCGWVLGQLRDDNREVDPVVKVALKHWSRALIGRTAAQWSRWEQIGTSPRSDVSLGRCRDVSAGETFELMQVGHQLIRNSDRTENPDALVAIMSWVMAEARVRLWRTMECAGLEHVAYVDTDSLIVDPVGHERLLTARLSGLRVKGCWSSVEVFGPRQLVLSGRLRAAGIPYGSVELGHATWEGEVWSGLGTSLRLGEADRVSVARRTFRLHGTDHRRRHLPGGVTAPFELGEVMSHAQFF